MRRPFTVLVLAAATALPAFGETITIPPGLWSYSGTAQLGAGQMTDSGQECFRSGNSTYDLSKAAQSIADGCDLVSSSPMEDGVSFQIACTGALKGELSGEFLLQDDTAELSATGWTGTPETQMPVAISATAQRVADACS